MTHSFPKLHNAAWPGLVGKEPGGPNPPIALDAMLDYTASAELRGQRFDGIDLFLSDPHVSIDASDDDLKVLADKIGSRNLVVGSVVAPVWPVVGGGAANDEGEGRKAFLRQIRKACNIARKLTDLGIRPYGVVRIDSAVDTATWAEDPEGNQKRIAETFRQAGDIAADAGQRLAAEGEVCWGGMHSWRRMVELLEMTDRPGVVGFQADMAHTLLYVIGTNAPEDAILPADYDWQDRPALDRALRKLTDALRPWMLDFHVAQNDGTVFGTGAHDKTGRHCLPNDVDGKLDIVRHAGFWLRDGDGKPVDRLRHICWDGCMFPNAVMEREETWNNILGALLAVRKRHGWDA